MPNIMGNIDLFVECLLKNIPIVCEKEGEFRRLTTCEFMTQFLNPHQEKKRRIQIGKAFCDALDFQEKIPIRFSDDEVAAEQRSRVMKYLNVSNVVLDYLDFFSSNDVDDMMVQVLRRTIGMLYRVEKRHGGLDREESHEDLIEQLAQKAENWKKSQKLYPVKDKTLTTKDHEKIKEACQYPLFVEFILENNKLCEIFFKWSIRDNNGVSQFVEFPRTMDRMRETYIDKRVGRFNPNELAIVKKKVKGYSESYEKIIRLPFYDGKKAKKISILDESREVVLNNQRQIRIKDIFDIFIHKNIDLGNVDYFGVTGITNWAGHELGSFNAETQLYDRINVNEKEWWRELPTFEILSKEALEKKYHITIEPGSWVQTVKSTRESLDFKFMNRHGYIEMAIPTKEGQYAIYPFGTLPEHFPHHPLEQLKIFTATVTGKLAYPDENEVYSHRQRASLSSVISEKVGLRKMDEIKKYIVKSFEGNLVFQFSGENCSYFAEEIAKTADEKKSDIFKMSLLEMQPTHRVISYLLKCPYPLQVYILGLLQYAAEKSGMEVVEDKEVIYKCTLFGRNFHQQYQYQPGRLNQLIEEGKREGVITYGN